ncbi:DUF6915 family protein [Sphingomonas sp. 3-13AW]|uniref:DUF6915 family protein n=1 Tax=Sphingomonas sp. 3-13AW TaxID=3050450 RepID=UPI003BB6D1AF
MNPYDHARSSAALHGGSWQDYHRLHSWFDETKAALCHFTHRALRHHTQGIEEAVRVFGATITNGDGACIPVSGLGRQHMDEDCQHVPDATEWLIDFRPPDWMPARDDSNVHDLADLSARRFGGAAETYLPLHRWFLETRTWAGGLEHLLFRHHSFGIFEAEARFGPILTDGANTVPTRVVAERHVQTVLGRVPAAADWLRRIKGSRWMLQATNARKLGLDARSAA